MTRYARTLVVLAASLYAGCGTTRVEPATEGYAARGFSDLSGARSDVGLPPPMPTDDGFDYAFREHMDKQDPRWSDKQWRDSQKTRRIAEVEAQRRAARRAEQRRREEARERAAGPGY